MLGGPGRSIEIAGTHADGWASYFPACGDAEWFAGRRQELREFAERAGRDPDAQIVMGMFLCVMEETDAAAEALCDNLALRWDAAVMMPSGASWHQWNPDNPPHPFGDEFHYARDLIPMEWSREDAAQSPSRSRPRSWRNPKFTGSPKTIANMIAPYIDAGMTHVLVANYGQLVTTGDFSDAVANVNLLAETNRAKPSRLRRFGPRSMSCRKCSTDQLRMRAKPVGRAIPPPVGNVGRRSATRTQSRP